MFVGATSVIYLLANGATLGQIAYLKLIQGSVFLIAEVPTGTFADLHGRRKSLIISTLLALAGFALYFLGNGFEVFAIAEILTALSLCFWSGAYEAYCVEYADLNSAPAKLDRFFHLNQATVSVAVLICGLLGSAVAEYNLGYAYLAGIFTFAAALGILAMLPADEVIPQSAKSFGARVVQLGRSSKEAVIECLKSPALIPLFVASIAVQFSIQPLLHYWQPFFESVSPGLPVSQLGVVFTSYTALGAVLGLVYSRFTDLKFFRSYVGTIALFGLFSVLYLFLGQASGWWPALILFAGTQGALTLARTSLMARINEQSSSENRARVLSSVSLFSRFGMMGALFIIPAIVRTQEIGPQHTAQIYKTFSYFSVAAVGLILLSMVLRRKFRK